MLGYSWSKSDFRELLVRKYKPMEEFILVTSSDCSKCKFLKPHVEKRCEEHKYKFKEMEYNQWFEDISSIPSAIIWEDVVLDYDGILELLTGKK